MKTCRRTLSILLNPSIELKTIAMKKNILLVILLFSITIAFAQNYGKGLVFDDEKYASIPISAPLIKGDYDLPASASLKDYCPTPKSQGTTGTCVGWATAYSARTIIEAIQLNITGDEINNQVFSPSFIYEQIKDPSDLNCLSGASINDALYIMKTVGSVKMSDLPFQCSIDIDDNTIKKAEEYKIKDYKKLFNVNSSYEAKINSVKKSISENKPVVIGMNTPDSFKHANGKWEPSPTDSPDGDNGGHAMTVMAYDDNMYDGSFQVINSWGTNWGEQGFTWIRYQDFADYVRYGYELIEAPKAAPSPTEIVLQGKLAFVQKDGTNMVANRSITAVKNLVVAEDNTIIPDEKLSAYKMVKKYPTGTMFQINMTNNKEAYLYALATDLSGKINIIFPPENKNISPYLGYTNSTIPFPTETSYIKMDDNVGRDYLCLLYSKEELDLNSIKQIMQNQPGTFSEKILAALHTKLVPFDDIKYSNNEIGFEAVMTSNENYVVPLMVEIGHK